MRVDLQKALELVFPPASAAIRFMGFSTPYPMPNFGFATLLDESAYAPVIAPAQYVELDVGEAMPARCLENGLWLFEEDEVACALLLSSKTDYGGMTTVLLELAVPPGETGAAIVRRYFDTIEARTLAATTYRGKVLSLQQHAHRSNQATGITVHSLPAVSREDIILPASTMSVLERNVLGFVHQRAKLGRLRMSTKKGLLLYGPPGTGKTHTI
jgi:hypothetical protein